MDFNLQFFLKKIDSFLLNVQLYGPQGQKFEKVTVTVTKSVLPIYYYYHFVKKPFCAAKFSFQKDKFAELNVQAISVKWKIKKCKIILNNLYIFIFNIYLFANYDFYASIHV